MDADGELPGGNSLSPVYRVGATVRKARAESTPAVHAFVRHLAAHGVDVPMPLESADPHEQVWDYIPGTLAIDMPPLGKAQLTRVGRIVREMHDAAEDFSPPRHAVWTTAIPAPGADLVCHNDLAPWNLIVGERLVFVDWDACSPSTRLWDLAYAAQTFCLNDADRDPVLAAASLRALIDGYEASAPMRSELADAMIKRVAAMGHLLASSHANGIEPWATMHVEGHGAHWRSALDYVSRHAAVWHAALTRESPPGGE